MTDYVLIDVFGPYVQDANGAPLVNGSIEAFIAGTSTPTPIYFDAAGSAYATSVKLNSLGRPQTSGGTATPIYAEASITYKFVVKDAYGTPVPPTIEPYNPAGSAGVADKGFTSVAQLQASSGNGGYETIFIESYYAVTYPSSSGPRGGHYRYRTSANGEPGSVSGAYVFDGEGVGWKISDDDKKSPICFGAKGDGVTDDSAAFQRAIDSGLNICTPPGEYFFSNSVIIHDRAGLRFVGAGADTTVFTASAAISVDTAAISALGLDHSAEYAKNCFFLITEYDGEFNRADYSARNHYFEGMSFNVEGGTGERLISAFSSPSLAHTKFKDILAWYCYALFHGWIFSDDTGDHYHLLFDDCRSIGGVHHVTNDYESSARPSIGTTWILRDNSIVITDNGYNFGRLNYVTIDSCSVDSTKKGSYALELFRCSGTTIITPGIETRYQHAGTGYGGGLLKFTQTSAVITSGFIVGGDRNATGSGSITDYDNGSGNVADSLLVLDSSVVDVIDIEGDWQVAASSTVYWPWFLKNGSVLRFSQGLSESGGYDSHFDVNDTSTAFVNRIDGTVRKITSSANELACFEATGDWNPVLADAASGGNEASLESASGKFFKKGRLVRVVAQLFNVNTSGLTGANDIFVIGLPFTVASHPGTIRYIGSCSMSGVAFTGTVNVTVTDNENYIKIQETVSGGLEDFVTVGEINSGTGSIWVDVEYETDQ
jgi:hypothetical protein